MTTHTIESLMALHDDAIHRAELIGVSDAKKGYGMFTEQDSRSMVSLQQSNCKARAALRAALTEALQAAQPVAHPDYTLLRQALEALLPHKSNALRWYTPVDEAIDVLRAELGQYPEIQAMLMSENKQLRYEHLSATKPFEKYLKEGETPIQRLEREIKDGRALMTVYGKALAQIQELQQQQDTPVAFYDIAHDEDGEIEYEFSVYPRPGFKPLFAQSIAAAPVAVQAVPAVCEWTQDTQYENGDTYYSACGKAWVFNDGGPTDNHVSYCHHCGKKVQLAAAPKGAV